VDLLEWLRRVRKIDIFGLIAMSLRVSLRRMKMLKSNSKNRIAAIIFSQGNLAQVGQLAT
jgi:hypothetical protein